jgi:2-iminobutanoate/2-iminopropanoate deaminase
MGPYSPGLKVGNMVFVSGQGPVDPQGNIVGETIEEQTAKVLENIRLILAEAGATMADVVKCTVHLSDLALFERYNRVYVQHFPDPKPVRTTVGSQLLGILVEIDVIAILGAGA